MNGVIRRAGCPLSRTREPPRRRRRSPDSDSIQSRYNRNNRKQQLGIDGRQAGGPRERFNTDPPRPREASTQTLKKDSTETLKKDSTETLKRFNGDPSKGRVKNKGAYMSAYGDFLMLTPVRVVVAAGFLAYGIMTVVLIDRIEQGLPRTSLAPDDSFLVGFFSIFDTTYQAQEGLILDLHVQGVDHSHPDIQARVMAAWGLHLQSPLTESLHKPAGGWMTAQNTRLDTRYSSPISWLTMATQVSLF